MLLLNIAGHLRHRGGAADLLLAVQEPAYEEFARLAETRLAQNTLDYLNISYVLLFLKVIQFNIYIYIYIYIYIKVISGTSCSRRRCRRTSCPPSSSARPGPHMYMYIYIYIYTCLSLSI